MSAFSLEVPVNNVSFGNVSIAILRELQKRDLNPPVFPIGPVDLSSQKGDPYFAQWLNGCVNTAQQKHNRKNRAVRLWHIANSLQSYSNHGNDLVTFQETGQLTPLETHILNQQRKVYVTNRYAQSFFKMCGVEAVHLPLGFDSFNFHTLEKRPTIPGVTSWLLLGKAEARKHTYRQLALWAKKYGNQKEHKLNLSITNPFLKSEDQNGLIAQALGGKQYWNLNFLQWSPTNVEYNTTLQSSDIVLCCSGTEGFGLPEYHAAALGAWPVALKAHAYLDYFTDENAVLVKPNGMEPIVDNIFFHANALTNTGNRFTFSDEDFYAGCAEAERRVKELGVNRIGMELQKTTYAQTVDILLKEIA